MNKNNFSLIHMIEKENSKKSEIYTQQLTDMKSKIISLTEEIITNITSATHSHENTISGLSSKYGSIKEKLRQFSDDEHDHKESKLFFYFIGEDELCKLISESTDCTEIVDFSRNSQDIIRDFELLKEDINLKKFVILSHEYFKKNKLPDFLRDSSEQEESTEQNEQISNDIKEDTPVKQKTIKKSLGISKSKGGKVDAAKDPLVDSVLKKKTFRRTKPEENSEKEKIKDSTSISTNRVKQNDNSNVSSNKTLKLHWTQRKQLEKLYETNDIKSKNDKLYLN